MSNVQAWILGELAALLEAPRAELSATQVLVEQGVDSASMVQLSGILSERLGVTLDPMLLYEHPTVEKLAVWLEQTYPAAAARCVTPAASGVALQSATVTSGVHGAHAEA